MIFAKVTESCAKTKGGWITVGYQNQGKVKECLSKTPFRYFCEYIKKSAKVTECCSRVDVRYLRSVAKNSKSDGVFVTNFISHTFKEITIL